MALYGSFEGIYKGFTYRVEWNAEQSVSGNYSQIVCEHKLVCARYYALYIGTRANSSTIGDTTIAFNSPAISTDGNETVSLGTTTHIIYHDADGSREPLPFKGVFNMKADIVGTWVESIEATGTITLDTIPRATTPTLGASSAEIGSSITITTDGALDAFVHTLTYSCGSVSGTIGTNIKDSISWTIPTSIASALPSSTSGTVNIVCYTYNGESLIGSTHITLNVQIPSSYVPSISKLTITDANGYEEAYGKYIQNKSQIRCEITASGVGGSTIAKYETVISSQIYTGATITSAILTTSGKISILTRVTDSRGRITEVTNNVDVIEYFTPTIESFTAYRSSSDGTRDDDEGTYLRCTATFSCSDLESQNTKSWYIYCGLIEAETLDLVASGTGTTIDYKSANPVFNLDDTYLVQVHFKDNFATIQSKYALIETAFTLMDFGASGHSLSLGGASTRDEGFEVKLPSFFSESVEMESLTVGGVSVTGGGQTSVKTASGSWDAAKTITCGFKPDVVFITETNLDGYSVGHYTWYTSIPWHVDVEGYTAALTVTNDGFTVSSTDDLFTMTDHTYYYLAVKFN